MEDAQDEMADEPNLPSFAGRASNAPARNIDRDPEQRARPIENSNIDNNIHADL